MITILAISRSTLLRAQPLILGCEACSPDAEIPLDWILDEVTSRSGDRGRLRSLGASEVPEVLWRGYGEDAGGERVG